MTFYVGQKVVCVDDSLPANPWHRANPLIKNKIYVVQDLNGPQMISIDASGRAWQNFRFRLLVEKKTDISIFTEILEGENSKKQRVKVSDYQS